MEKDDLHYQFYIEILKALHLNSGLFFKNLAEHSTYEVIIYKWIDKLFNLEKSTSEALQLILKARNIHLLGNKQFRTPKPLQIF